MTFLGENSAFLPSAPFNFNERHNMSSHCKILSSTVSMQEASDDYSLVVARFCDRHRVIACRERIQWIAQRRKWGGAERPWRSVGYFRTREALVRACATLCGRIDPAAMAILLALPSHFGGAS